jgi:phosphatidylserine/phosphatidylglycerophosphate/cardiolipin synthase-like enzyme
MDRPAKSLAAAAAKLAAELPSELVEVAAEVLLASADLEAARRGIADRIAHSQYRQTIDGFLSKCASATSLLPAAIGASLLAAAASEQSSRARQEVEVVWTGPHSEAIAFRRTEQVILQVLDSATSRITLASYAVYAIPRVRAALVRAAQRGVRINVILETPDRMSGQSEYDTLSALGAEVARCSSVYYWPEGKRPREGAKTGILHAKCLVADSRWLFVSSANLTEYAFSINMELGVLMTGGRMPRQVEALFDSLIAEGQLVPI